MDNKAFSSDSELDVTRVDGEKAESRADSDNVVHEAYRYSAEKKALEAVDNATIDVLVLPADKPYAGMGKEDLLRFSQTPFWNRLRLICTIIFWLAWLGLLVTVIVLVVTFPQCSPPPERSWYQKSVIYQIYVRSFYDSDGDGVGDINGVRGKLDYLESVGVNAVLLSSVYASKDDQDGVVRVDYGYEILNHTVIDEDYGTMADFEMLLDDAHARDIKVIMDFIPNYTSEDHPWFVSSRSNSSVKNPYWNYYVWADCTDGVPNNWMSVYSAPAWSNATANRCYLHQFLPQQPELNLRSAAVQDELENILRFWLDQGVDGFRVDRTMYLFEDADLKNNPTNQQGCTDRYECYIPERTTSQDEVYPLIEKWRAILDEYTSKDGLIRILLTDAMDNINKSSLYYGKYGPDGAHLPLNYQLTKVNTTCNARCVFELVDSWVYSTPSFGTQNWLTGTQDIRRLADVIPQADWNDWSQQNAIMLLKMTLPGVAIMYYGEEIGMTSVNSTTTDPRDPVNPEYSRDPFRSPMQWNNDTYGGFVNMTNETSFIVDPWLPVGDNLYNISIEAQNGTDFTPYMFFVELSELRANEDTFAVGNLHYTLLTDNVISYFREYEGMPRFLVVINFGNAEDTFNIADSHYEVPNEADVVMTTRGGMSISPGDIADLRSLLLKPGEGALFRWEYVRPDGKPKNL